MIKVLFVSKFNDDIHYLIKNSLNITQEIEVFIENNIEGICFDCMDYLYDLENYYVCYFYSLDDFIVGNILYNLLNINYTSNNSMYIKVSIVDKYFNEIRVIGEL